jgi:hypothetical protein
MIEASKWFGKEVYGILLVHNVPFFVEVCESLLLHFIDEGVEFIRLEEAMTDPIYSYGASVVSDSRQAVVLHKKLAAASGRTIPRIVPEYETLYKQVKEMGQDIPSQWASMVNI